MRGYENKEELVSEIRKYAKLFIDEFSDISEEQKDTVITGVDRTPDQMITYQLGWMYLILEWEAREVRGEIVQTPSEYFKWNNLGGLYDEFYESYSTFTLSQLIIEYDQAVSKITEFVDNLSNDELFIPGGRKWAASTPANWPVWKWIHINTVAPFQTFRVKIRKWKRMYI